MNCRNIISYLIIITSLLSCKEEIPSDKDYGSVLTFTASEESRSTLDGYFEEDDAIGIFVYSETLKTYKYLNKKYVFKDSRFNPASVSEEIRKLSGEVLSFYAYYPYKEGLSKPTEIPHSIGNQETQTSWYQSDMLAAVHHGLVENNTVPLNFKHILATLEVKIEEGSEVKSAIINNVKNTISHNLLTGETTTKSASGNYSMHPYRNSEGIKYYRVLLPVQTLIAENSKINVTGKAQVTLQALEDITLSAGNVHTYKFDFKKNIQINDYLPGGTTTGAGLFELGEQHSIDVKPNPSYTFIGWYNGEDLISKNKLHSFKIKEDITFTPQYSHLGKVSLSLGATPNPIGPDGGNIELSASAKREYLVNGTFQKYIEPVDVTDYITMVKTAGFELSGNQIAVSKNTTDSERTAEVTLNWEGGSKSIIVRQSAGTVSYSDWVFNISANPSVISEMGGNSIISASASRKKYIGGVEVGSETATPQLSIPEGSPFSLSSTTVSVGENRTLLQRETTITATHDGKSAEFNIYQAAGKKTVGNWNITLTANPSTISAAGGSSTIEASATRKIFINGREETSESGTISLSINGNSQFTLTGNTVKVPSNETSSERRTIVTATCGDVSSSVELKQNGAEITYEFSIDGKTEVSTGLVSSKGHRQSFIIKSKKHITIDGNTVTRDVQWDYTRDATFVSVDPKGQLVVEENNTEVNRSATLKLTQKESGKTLTIRVLQKKKNKINIIG